MEKHFEQDQDDLNEQQQTFFHIPERHDQILLPQGQFEVDEQMIFIQQQVNSNEMMQYQEEGDGSKTTYESCSSFNSDDEHSFQDNHQNTHYITCERNECEDDKDNINEEQNDDNQNNDQLHTSKQSKKKQSNKHIINNMIQGMGEVPVQCRTLRLSCLKEAKLIQFEEYEPFNASNRNDQQNTGGRLTSQASNSNKYSFSKTFNFQMAFLNNQEEFDNQNYAQESNSTEKQQFENELTQRVDEKIKQIAEEYNMLTQTYQQSISKSNMGTQTFNFEEIQAMPDEFVEEKENVLMKSQLVNKYQAFENISLLPKTSDNQVDSKIQKRTQSHEQHPQQETIFTRNRNSNIFQSGLPQHEFNQTLGANNKRLSQINNIRIQDRMSMTANQQQNRTQSSSIPPVSQQDVVNSNQSAQGFNQKSQSTIIHNNNISQKVASHHERQWSESNSSCNQNLLNNNSQAFNGFSSLTFNRTMGPSFMNQHIQSNNKKRDDNMLDLKYMLENVQCEAKNLKLLLNLKDDQLQMYESKSQELVNENEDLSIKIEEKRQKLEVIEEENLYLRAIINSQGIQFGKTNKVNIGVLTDHNIDKISQACQATFPAQVKIPFNIKNIGLSPIKEQYESPEKVQLHLENIAIQESLTKKIQEQEKENYNLINTIQTEKDKVKKFEVDFFNMKSQLYALQKENQEIKKQYQQENKSLFWQIESQKQQIMDRDQKILEIVQLFEESQLNAKKKSHKIKSLKKERDSLKIEMIKMKQIYSDKLSQYQQKDDGNLYSLMYSLQGQKQQPYDKVDQYREQRNKLQRKLKKRDEMITRLEEKIHQYEKIYKRQGNTAVNQNSQQSQYPSDCNNKEYQGTTGKFGHDLDSSQQFRSSMSSRSLENTRNLGSTAKNHIRGLNQMNMNKNDGIKGELLLNQQHNTSLSNPPKSKTHQNLTPGSLPSGTCKNVYQNQYNNPTDDYHKDKGISKVKKHYKKLELEEEKLLAGQRHNLNHVQQQFIQNSGYYKNTINQNHFVSGDKSKSFYSSDIENTTLFENNIINPIEEQSNSSNFFSNINNSNSHIVMNDSAFITKEKYNEFMFHQHQYQQQQYKNHLNNQNNMLKRIASNNQIKEKQLPQYDGQSQMQIQTNIQKPSAHQQQNLYSFNNSNGAINSRKNATKGDTINQGVQSYMSSIQVEDNQNQLYYKNYQQLPQQNQQQQKVLQSSKSPIFKGNQPKNATTETTLIQRNRSSQNLSQGELQNVNTQNSLRQQRNDSATSSNRNLHQVKDMVRPPSTSSTNNTSAIYHNQVAMISYQSSSSGGSKQQLPQKQTTNIQPSQPQKYPGNTCYAPLPYFSTKPTSTQMQFVQQNYKASGGNLMNNSSFNQGNPNEKVHKRQRSRQLEDEEKQFYYNTNNNQRQAQEFTKQKYA